MNPRKSTLRLLRGLAISAILLLPGLLPGAEQEVRYEDHDDYVLLDNGLVRLEIFKHDATIRSVIKDEVELLNQSWGGANRGAGYIQMYPNNGFRLPQIDEITVEERDGLVDVRFHQKNMNMPFVLDVHYVIREGVSGFYGYMVLGYDREHFDEFVGTHNGVAEGEVPRMDQLNFCFRFDDDIFIKEQVADTRKRSIPHPDDYADREQLYDATYQLTDGRVYTKYDMSFFHAKHQVHGIMGNGFGVFVMQGTGEHLNGGPTTQELATHDALILQHFNAAHYGSGPLTFDPREDGWEKLAGPFLFYINTGENHEKLWWDARTRAREFAGEAPYAWMDHPLYPVERGSVSGRLEIADGTDPRGALVFLAQPEDDLTPEWQRQGKDFFFWSWVERDGSFEIPGVRPNEYSLYVLHDDQFGEFQYDGVEVAAGETTDLGDLTWEPEVIGDVVWQIGRPNRDASEYVLGEGLKWGRWDAYRLFFPDDIDFTIGKSEEGRDWFYAHQVARDDDGERYAPTWTVRFDIDGTGGGDAALRMGVAGVAGQTGLRVALNGENIGEGEWGHDAGPSRSGNRGRYREALFTFDGGLLRSGENVLTLELRPGSLNYGSMPSSILLYDALRLEWDRE